MINNHPYDNNRVILCDVDGVLLNWVASFREYAGHSGYQLVDERHYDINEAYDVNVGVAVDLTSHHNESLRMACLSPMKDAVKYVRRLHEWHGYVLHCITALDPDPLVIRARETNLRNLFGNAVESVVLTGTYGDKRQALEQYRSSGCLWIEDKPENAELGVELGLDTLLVDQPYNRHFNNKEVRRVNNWSEIYDIVVGA